MKIITLLDLHIAELWSKCKSGRESTVGTNEQSLESLVRFSDDFHRLALLKMNLTKEPYSESHLQGISSG